MDINKDGNNISKIPKPNINPKFQGQNQSEETKPEEDKVVNNLNDDPSNTLGRSMVKPAKTGDPTEPKQILDLNKLSSKDLIALKARIQADLEELEQNPKRAELTNAFEEQAHKNAIKNGSPNPDQEASEVAGNFNKEFSKETSK